MFLKSKFSKSALASCFAVAAMFSTQSANSADATTTLSVSAQVQAACVFGTIASPNATGYLLGFGNFVLSSAGADATAQASIDVECASPTSYTLGTADIAPVSGRTMITTGTSVLKYELRRNSATGPILDFIGGSNVFSSAGLVTSGTHTIFGVIPQAGNGGAAPGAYTDTVTLTLRF
jgi:spore coat protein U-like protein